MGRTGLIAVALAMGAAACGGGDAADTTTSAVQLETTTATVEPTTTTTVAPTTTTADVVTTTSLTGEPIDIGPQRGDSLAVIGVAHNDVLNVRMAPGIDQPIVAELAPLADDVVALGNARALPASIWLEVEAEGVTGWASSSFLGYIGQTSDATAAVVEQLGGLPTAPTMADLGMVVAGALVSDGPPSSITMSVAPTVGDLGEATFDVIGIRDDAVRGFRIRVFATPDDDGEGFVLKSIEQTLICGRGLSGELCV